MDKVSSSPSIFPVLHDMEIENRGKGNEFFPEDSFKSWGEYGKAFLRTPFRLKERMFTRSKDYMEIVEMKARSNHQMKKTLDWLDLIWFGIGAVIGSGIFVLTGLEAREEAGPAVVLSYIVSGISALLSVFLLHGVRHRNSCCRWFICILESRVRRLCGLHSRWKHTP
ncbi:unnamed protein product [Vicia faba]|uniref:Uncharacterized protein n=1 Tax=Vicia faba TaxID=3906 RepID=A0AAV1B9D2_VICFA|nr:unnamed protein product [Vicia faba]